MISSLKIHSNCIKCDMCRVFCPENAIIKIKDEYFLESWACSSCSVCTKICPVDCIKDEQSRLDKEA